MISLTGCIIDGLISILSLSKINLEISVGFTEPYNSLFSVLSFFTLYSFLFIFSEICFASFFLSLSFFAKSDLIFSTCEIFSLDAYRAFLFEIR